MHNQVEKSYKKNKADRSISVCSNIEAEIHTNTYQLYITYLIAFILTPSQFQAEDLSTRFWRLTKSMNSAKIGKHVLPGV